MAADTFEAVSFSLVLQQIGEQEAQVTNLTI